MSRVLGGVGERVGEEVQVERGPVGPAQFWRGQSRYVVGELLDSWVETAPWWQHGAGAGGASAGLVANREVWRVEAARGLAATGAGRGVFDPVFDWAQGGWSLSRCAD